MISQKIVKFLKQILMKDIDLFKEGRYIYNSKQYL